MDMNETDQVYVRDLLTRYPFQARFENLLIQIQDVLEALGALDLVTVNTDLLGRAVLNYFEDIDRLKSFEGIQHTNEEKIYGYMTFWLLRTKPIQFVTQDVPREFLFINEKVFTWMLISKMLRESGIDPDSQNPDLMPLLRLLLYYFKYRHFTQQSLELMITAFFCGCQFAIPDHR